MILVYNAFQGFIGTVSLLISSISRLIYTLIGLLGQCFSFLFDIISVLPTAFTVSFVALVAIAIIYKLLGREAGN